jgi:K+-sensing histidine kinase KdpD
MAMSTALAATQGGPILPFIFSVTVSAWYGGLLPGLVATVLGATVGVYFFFPPAWSFNVHDPADWLRLTIFS